MTAAAARKLQKEIDTVLKKVEDGLQEFDDCWEQALSAGSSQQKERLGEELKRCINKLQRFRAQIREWISQNGVQTDAKDKLEDARKRVEHDMQRFKDFERDLKTKAFSTCALAKGDELELEEAEKMKYQDWLGQTIQSLNDQLDQFEADLELLGNKRSLSSDDKARQSQLRTLQETHRWHIKKLEQVLRGVDNEAIDLGDLAVVRDSIDYYVENNQDENCYHDDSLYDCFDLTELDDKAMRPKSPSEPPKECGTPGSASAKEDPQKKVAGKDKEKRRKDEKKDKKREEKKAVTPQGNTLAAGPAKGAVAKAVDVKLVQPVLAVTDVAVDSAPGEAKATEPDEIKVQEDQLLSEAEEFICKICQIHVAGCGPKLTSCSHLFCGDCIAQWFNQHPKSQTWAQRAKSAGPDRVVPCPVCKQPLSEKRDLYPVCGVTSRSENLLLWRMLSSLKVVCVNHPKVRKDGKCDWVGEYGSYQRHAPLCKNAACAGEGPRPAETIAAPSLVAASEPAVPAVVVEPVPAPAPVPTPVQTQATDASGGSPVTVAAAKHQTTRSASPQARTRATAASPAQSPRAKPAPAAATNVPIVAEEAPLVEAASPEVSAQVGNAAVLATSTSEGSTHIRPGAVVNASVAADQQQSHEVEARDGEICFSGRAVSSFDPTGSNTMTVRAGDLLQVMEQHSSGWTYAKNLSLTTSNNVGWIPSWVVPQQQQAQQSQPSQPQPQQLQPQRSAQEAVVATQPKGQAQSAQTLVQLAAGAVAPAASAPQTETRPILRACAAFTAGTSSQLTLSVADLVEIVERHASGWTYGRKVSDVRGDGAAEGWFPDWVVPSQAAAQK